MSFILKALKKLEEEKAVRTGGEVDLPRALLRADAPPVQVAPRLVRWGVIVLVFAAGSGLTYLLTRSPVTSVQMAQPAATPTAANAPPVPAPPPAVPVSDRLREPAPELAASGQQRKVSARRQTHPKPALPANAGVMTEQQPRVLPPPELRVNGIALQDDAYESVAVVNGALVRKGMTVGGIRVEEIFQDRVRFAGAAGTFEVQLSK